jgi:hypothetical protein
MLTVPVGVAIDAGFIGVQTITATGAVISVGQCRTPGGKQQESTQENTKSQLKCFSMECHGILLLTKINQE